MWQGMTEHDIRIHHLGRTEYQPTWTAMQAYTDARDATTVDELWVTEHLPVYTQGLNGRPEHLLQSTDIPLVQVDRGGQVTYHGPGQLVIYTLLNLPRRGFGVKGLVARLEASVIELLSTYDIAAAVRAGAPGVYVAEAKIAALGLRIRKGCCYHGLSLNVDMNLTPFQNINPCGFPGLAVTQLRDLGVTDDIWQVGHKLSTIMSRVLR